MKLRVTGLRSPPSIFWMRPCSTVTSMVQESGQSSGHAVRMVDLPQVSGGAVRAIPQLSNAERPNDKCRMPFGIRPLPFVIWHSSFEVGALSPRTHVDAG